MIGDILVKISKREPLSIMEKLEIQDFGRAQEELSRVVPTFQDGTGEINALKVDSVNGFFRWQPYGLSSKIRFSASVPTATITHPTYTEIVYDELGGFNATKFIIKTSAWYEYDVFCSWDTASGGLRQCEGYSHSSSVSPIVSHGWRIKSIAGSATGGIVLNLYQNSGSTLSCSGSIIIRILEKFVPVID